MPLRTATRRPARRSTRCWRRPTRSCHRRAPEDADLRDRTLRGAVAGHCRGGAPGGRGCGRAHRRGPLGRPQSPCRSRRHHLQHRAVAGRPVVLRQLSSSVVGDRPVPTRAPPEVVARVAVDPDPVDMTDADEPGGCAPAWSRISLNGWRGWQRRWRRQRRTFAAGARGRRRGGGRRLRPCARGRPARRHHDVGAVARPAREPPALPAPPRPSGGRPGGAWVSAEGVDRRPHRDRVGGGPR